MKKLLLFTAGIFMLCNASIKAQITLEHTYLVPQGKEFYFTDLGNNNYKYFLIDYFNDNFSLYNLDHTPYMLNIIPGVSLDSGLYDIAYITTTLFDCDSTNIEYVEASNTSAVPFYIFRTDGTLLFSQDSTVGPYCVGCFDGSINKTPIFNTPSGTKMLLANLYTNVWSVYSLCGTVPESIKEIEQNNKYVQIYPNPTSGTITFKIDAPSNTENYELTIYDSSLQNVRSEHFNGSRTITINNDNLSSGGYFFSLQSKNKIIQTGKFVITK